MPETEPDGPGGLNAGMVQLVLKEAKDLIRSLEGTAISRISVAAGPLHIEVERAGSAGSFIAAPVAAAAGGAPAAAAAAPGVMPVVAPLVGVFYRASSPGAKVF